VFARFFIDRPIFAAVLSIAITLAGALSLSALPLALYPPIAPPTVQIDCRYPGASAREVAETVAAPIEQQVNGVEGMLYMSSQCTNDGSYNLTVTFRHGTNRHMAQVLVQNRVALALPRLPEVIKQAGVTARTRSPDILLAIALNSPGGRYDQLFISNYASMYMKEELARLPGVSDVNMFGQQDYSMRIWLDPDKLAARSLGATDVVAALREQNRPVPSGQIGQPPGTDGQVIQVPIHTLGRLDEPEEFGEIVVKVGERGQMVRLKDVARIELAERSRDVSSRVNGNPSASLAVFLLPDANALETGELVKAKIGEMAKDFPEGLRYEIRYDTTPFIRESINEVFKTLRESVILVAIVVLLFLQSWRSALIPLVAVPVAIVGTFAVMAAMGFSLNNLTLFGLVLSIGIVVDDAIVVVEAVEHHMERGLKPREATLVAMEEVSGPVIAIGLVLSAVFVPCAFISGIVGQFFRQFALTIAASTLISTFNSLTLSPALAALLLKPRGHGREGERPVPLPRLGIAALFGWAGWALLTPRAASWLAGRGATLHAVPEWAVPAGATLLGVGAGWLLGGPINWLLSHLFAAFDAAFRWMTRGYVKTVAGMLRVTPLVLLGYGGLLYLTNYGARFDLPMPEGYAPREVRVPGLATTPKGFIPSQDMGYALVNVQLPDSSAVERTQAVMERLEEIAHTVPGVKHTSATTGQSLLLSAFGPNFGSMFVIMDEFANRTTPELYGEAIIGEMRKRFGKEVPEARVTVLGPPPVRGVGRAGGFKLMIEDRGDNTLQTLQEQAEALARAGNELTVEGRKPLADLTSVFSAKVPQLFVDVDRKEAMIKRVDLGDLFRTLQVYLGSLYVNDFNLFGRTFQVIAQADAPFRNSVEAVRRLKVRNAEGKMVPIGSLARVESVNGPLVLTRYNMHTAAPVNGSAAPGVSSGEAIALMDSLAKKELLPSMATEWTELAYLELQAGNTAMIVFGFAVAMVFLVLAAQYESWSLPLAVILVVPMCLLSAVAGVNLAGQDINIFTQIGFVVLVGLACKNAILIVEFARGQRRLGLSRREAALSACGLRLRPIVMTSLAFILGVVPLLVSHGAGAEMRRTLGTTVFSGMLGVTAFGLLLTPIFFVLIDWVASLAIFRSAAARRIGSILLGIFALGYVRQAARWAVQRRPCRKPVPSANGHPVPISSNEPSSNGHAPAPQPEPVGERASP
jgi:multidrug efflux pump